LAAVLLAGPGTPGREVVLEFGTPYALAPGPGVTVPLGLADTGQQVSGSGWALTLRLRLTSASLADACVHDSQLSYILRDNGTVVGHGLLPPGRPQVTAGPLPLGDTGAGHRLRLTVAVMIGQVDAGCRFILDPSGTFASAPGRTG
jgi:hypothetical protein